MKVSLVPLVVVLLYAFLGVVVGTGPTTCSNLLVMGSLTEDSWLMDASSKCVNLFSSPLPFPSGWPNAETLNHLEGNMEMIHSVLGEQLVAVETSMLLEDGLEIEERLGHGEEAEQEAQRRAAERNALLEKVQVAAKEIQEADARLFFQAASLMRQHGNDQGGKRRITKAVLDSAPIFLEKTMGMVFETLLSSSEQQQQQRLEGIQEMQRRFYRGASAFLQDVYADGQAPSLLQTQLLSLYAGSAGPFAAQPTRSEETRLASLMRQSPTSFLQNTFPEQSPERLSEIQAGLAGGAIFSVATQVSSIGRSIPGAVGERIQQITSKIRHVSDKIQKGIASAEKVAAIARQASLAAQSGGTKAGVQVVMNSIKQMGMGAMKGVGVSAKVGTGAAKAGLVAAKGGLISAKVGAAKASLVAAKASMAAIGKAIAAGSAKAVALAVKGSILAASASSGPVGWVVTAATAVVMLVQGVIKLFKRLAKRIRLKRAARVEAREGARQREALFGVERELSRREMRDIRKNDRNEERTERKKQKKERKESSERSQNRQARKKARKEKKDAKMEAASPSRQRRHAAKQEKKEKKGRKHAQKEETKKAKEEKVREKARAKVWRSEGSYRERLLQEGRITQEQSDAWKAMQQEAGPQDNIPASSPYEQVAAVGGNLVESTRSLFQAPRLAPPYAG